MAQGSGLPDETKKIALLLVNRSLVVHGKILGRRIRVLTNVRIVHRARERSRPRRTSPSEKRLRDWSGIRRRIAGLETLRQLHAKPVTSSLRAIDVHGSVTANSIRGTTFVGLKVRRRRRENRIRALTVICIRRVTHPLAEGLRL